MPEGGAQARGRQSALLSRMAHERWVAPEVGRLLDALAPFGESLPYDSDDASLIRVGRREYEKAIRVPANYVARANEHSAALLRCMDACAPGERFRRDGAVSGDDPRAQPRVFFLLQAARAHRRYDGRRCRRRHDDPPRSENCSANCGTNSCRWCVRSPIRPRRTTSCLRQSFPKDAQFDFGLSVAQKLGYDTTRGRLDLTHHPFAHALLGR